MDKKPPSLSENLAAAGIVGFVVVMLLAIFVAFVEMVWTDWRRTEETIQTGDTIIGTVLLALAVILLVGVIVHRREQVAYRRDRAKERDDRDRLTLFKELDAAKLSDETIERLTGLDREAARKIDYDLNGPFGRIYRGR